MVSLCTISCGSNKYCGTYVCPKIEYTIYEDNYEIYYNATLVLNKGGSGSYCNGDGWASHAITWEAKENVILITDGISSVVEEYQFQVFDGNKHLIDDKGQDFLMKNN